MDERKEVDAAPVHRVVRRVRVGMLFPVADGREMVTMMDGLRILRSIKHCGGNPEFLRMLAAMDGKDLKALRQSIERVSKLTSSEIVAMDDKFA